jgi:hypothetical protein
MNFRLVVQNADGSQKWELPYDSWSFTEELNKDRSGTIKFTDSNVEQIGNVYSVSPEFIFSAGYREIYIFDEANNRIYGGYLAEPSVSKDANGKKTRTIATKGFFHLLEKRLTNIPPVPSVFYASDYATDIAWDLINTTQALDFGGLGITRGSHPNDVLNQRTFRYHTIKQAIEKLDNNNTKDGIDHEITPLKVFNTFFPTKGSLRSTLLLEDGFNIDNYSVRKNFIDAMANQVVALGEGEGDAMITSLADAEDIYKENFFLLQETVSEKDTGVQDNLDRKAEKWIETYKPPRINLQLACSYESPLWTEYEVGDELPVKILDESIDDNFRLRQRTLNYNGEVTLTFLPK